jgi:hypothetical protein
MQLKVPYRSAAKLEFNCWVIAGVMQMAGETIKILLMIALIGGIEVALYMQQIHGAVHRTLLAFLPPRRQMRPPRR